MLNGLGSGTSWSLGNSGVTNNLYGVPLFGSKDITVGSGGLILRSTNLGVNWFSPNSMTHKNIYSVEYSVNNTSRIYCVGDSGLILKSTNDGFNWGFQNSGTNNNLHSVFFYLDDNTGYAVGDNGTILKTTDGGGLMTSAQNFSDGENVASEYSLEQNYPNPFNPITHLEFGISKLGFVTVKIYDVLGNEVETLLNENKIEGSYEIEFNGEEFSSGIYFYSLFVDGNLIDTKRMVLLK